MLLVYYVDFVKSKIHNKDSFQKSIIKLLNNFSAVNFYNNPKINKFRLNSKYTNFEHDDWTWSDWWRDWFLSIFFTFNLFLAPLGALSLRGQFSYHAWQSFAVV